MRQTSRQRDRQTDNKTKQSDFQTQKAKNFDRQNDKYISSKTDIQISRHSGLNGQTDIHKYLDKQTDIQNEWIDGQTEI